MTTMTKRLTYVLLAWLVFTAVTLALPHARAASNVVAPSKVSDTAQPSSAP